MAASFPFRARDSAVSGVLLAAALLEVAVGAVQGPPAVAVPAGVVATGALIIRVRTPRVTFALTALALASLSLFDVPLSSIAVLSAMLIASYSLAKYVPLRPALTLGAVAVAIQSVALWGLADSSPSDVLFELVLVGAPFAAGLSIRSRQRYADAMAERAVLIERSRDDQARAAVAEERARMARELHDVIAHHLSVAVIQAVAARGELDDVPDASAGLRHLGDVEESCRRAMTEMRELLGVLRPSDGDSPVAPAPGITAVDDLVERVRRAGLPVELVVEGEPPEVPPSVGLALYRVVQESLTNALRHSGRAPTRLVIRYEPSIIEIEVLDDGREPAVAATGPGRGRGLIGMGDRVGLHGGLLEAGPRSCGGFRVYARLPLHPDPT